YQHAANAQIVHRRVVRAERLSCDAHKPDLLEAIASRREQATQHFVAHADLQSAVYDHIDRHALGAGIDQHQLPVSGAAAHDNVVGTELLETPRRWSDAHFSRLEIQ